MTDNMLKKSIYLKAEKSAVWAYLTEPEKIGTWFHTPKSALADGQEYAMYGRDSGDKLMWGEVQVYEPHDRLEYTFSIAPMGGAISTVKWQLDEVPGGTRLSLEHVGLPQGAEAFDLTLALDKGWDGHFDELRAAIHGN